MAIIDHANFDFEGKKIFAWECPERNLSSLTQLNVRPGQEALLVLGGRIEKKFPPNGSRPYTLDTANLPVVRKLFGIPFGGSNPILATVWFINKADIVNMEIKTDTFLLKDPTKQQGFPAIAIANMGVKVEESEPFFIKLVNGNPCFSDGDLINSLKGRINRIISEKVSQLVDQLNLTIADINTRLSMISQQSRDVCTQFIEEWGLQFIDFNVRITQDTSKEGLMMASGYGADAATYAQQRLLDIQEKAINNLSGGGNGLLGAVLAMGMMNSMNSSFHQPMPYQVGNQTSPTPSPSPVTRMVYCSNCGKKYDASSNKFCTNCGKEYNPCPRCGSDNVSGSKRCVNCGTSLQGVPDVMNVCSRCGTTVPNDSNFCPKCGNKMK